MRERERGLRVRPGTSGSRPLDPTLLPCIQAIFPPTFITSGRPCILLPGIAMSSLPKAFVYGGGGVGRTTITLSGRCLEMQVHTGRGEREWTIQEPTYGESTLPPNPACAAARG